MKKTVDVKNLEEETGSRLNMVLFYETLAQILGDKYGYEIKVTSIINKQTGEELIPQLKAKNEK